MTLARLKKLALQRIKAIAAGVLTAAAVYIFGCIHTHSPFSLTGLEEAVIASPVIAGIVHQLENAD